MKKMAVLLLVLLTMATLAGTASAKARGMIVFDLESSQSNSGKGMPMAPGRVGK